MRFRKGWINLGRMRSIKQKKKVIGAKTVLDFTMKLLKDDLHAKRVLSVANGALGVIHAASLSLHAIGQGLAQARGLKGKHAVKQVDRLLSNAGIDVWALFAQWVPYMVGARKEIVVSMDWTEFDRDDPSTIAINMITRHGRATPLMWLSVVKSELEGWRNAHEDVLLDRLAEVLPDDVKVTVLADRGFGDQKLYRLLTHLGFDFVIRFRGNILVRDAKGIEKTAAEWVPNNGRPRMLVDAQVTGEHYELPAVVCVKAAGMKDPWCLAVSKPELKGAGAVKIYGRRFTCEENFRDTKNLRFGMGLSSTRIGKTERRDRLLLLSALATSLLTLLGAAGESLGMDRWLKVNTVKKRTHSLFRQGCYYYGCIPEMPDDELAALAHRFGEMVLEQPLFSEVFGTL